MTNKHDMVNHPPHYNKGSIEVIDIIELLNTPYHIGNAIKYICRSDSKGNEEQDLQKALWYLNRYSNSSVFTYRSDTQDIESLKEFIKSQKLNLLLSDVLWLILKPGNFPEKRLHISTSRSLLAGYLRNADTQKV